MNIIDAIKERRSVRSFNGVNLSKEQVEALRAAVDGTYCPFAGNVTIRLEAFDLRGGYKPSTYGMINGATDFFLLGIKEDEESALEAGFRFEQVVLKAWQMGLGTCWIAATFKGSDFDRGQNWPDGESLRVICPVGVPVKPSIKEKITRLTLRSANRKPFDAMFFYHDVNTPIPDDNRFREALEMMRLAPSSTNSQPWRAIVEDGTVHFYYVNKSPASILDCGIGMCHFWETEVYNNVKGEFFKSMTPSIAPKDWIYLRSYRVI